jgi:hypothetical protein
MVIAQQIARGDNSQPEPTLRPRHALPRDPEDLGRQLLRRAPVAHPAVQEANTGRSSRTYRA